MVQNNEAIFEFANSEAYRIIKHSYEAKRQSVKDNFFAGAMEVDKDKLALRYGVAYGELKQIANFLNYIDISVAEYRAKLKKANQGDKNGKK